MRTMHAFVLLASGVLLVASSAHAQQGGPKLRLGAGAVVDFAGGLEVDPPGSGNNYNDGMRATPGLRGHLDYDLARYFSLGGFARFSWWKGDDQFSDGRSMYIDFGARLRAKYDYKDYRFYGVFMLGPTIERLNNDYDTNLRRTAVGVTAAIAPGVEWWFDPDFGLFLEMFGWTGHYVNHDVRTGPGSVTLRVNQVLWQFGVLFALR